MNDVYNGYVSGVHKKDVRNKQNSGSTADDKITPEFQSKRSSFRELLDETRYDEDVQRRRKEWRDWLQQDDRHRNFPLMFPEMVGLPRTVTNKDGRSLW